MTTQYDIWSFFFSLFLAKLTHKPIENYIYSIWRSKGNINCNYNNHDLFRHFFNFYIYLLTLSQLARLPFFNCKLLEVYINKFFFFSFSAACLLNFFILFFLFFIFFAHHEWKKNIYEIEILTYSFEPRRANVCSIISLLRLKRGRFML